MILDVVQTVFGFHIIEILDQKNKARAVQVATIARAIEPSEKTIDATFTEASKFELALQKETYTDAAKERDLTAKPVNGIKVLDENIPGLGSQRTIVRWALKTELKLVITSVFQFQVEVMLLYKLLKLLRKD